MTGRIDARLTELGLSLPIPPVPVANYVPTLIAEDLLYVSGQISPAVETGVLGREISVEEGREAARLCALNVIAQVKHALGGDLDRVVRCVKLTVFIAAAPDFGQHPEVANGASDLMVQVFGEAGKHVRSAVGAASLPRGVPCEVEAIFEIA